MSTLRTVLERIRREDLSLSPQKTSLFMTEVVFAGERVGRQGIRPDLAKLTAVVTGGPAGSTKPERIHVLDWLLQEPNQGLRNYSATLTDLCRE